MKAIRDIGTTTYVDVCTDQVLSTFPWGAADWLMLVLVSTVALAVAAMLGVMIFITTKDYREEWMDRHYPGG